MSREGRVRFPCHYGLGPVYLNEGLMKPRRGLTLAAGEGKLGVGKSGSLIDTLDSFLIISPPMNRHTSITDVPGIKVGHASDFKALTGCTVILCEGGAIGAADIRGTAAG